QIAEGVPRGAVGVDQPATRTGLHGAGSEVVDEISGRGEDHGIAGSRGGDGLVEGEVARAGAQVHGGTGNAVDAIHRTDGEGDAVAQAHRTGPVLGEGADLVGGVFEGEIPVAAEAERTGDN